MRWLVALVNSEQEAETAKEAVEQAATAWALEVGHEWIVVPATDAEVYRIGAERIMTPTQLRAEQARPQQA